MASELKVDKFTGVTTAGSILVTGEGNSTTTNLQQGLAKAWLQATNAAALVDSFNISGGTDNGTGDYTMTMQTAMANVRRIKTPDDIRPGTRKGKVDYDQVWMVRIKMPKALMKNVDRGYTNLDKNKVQDILSNSTQTQNPEPVDQTAQGTPDEAQQ